ncbi:MAG: hypothetical protein FWD61_15425 [Phycisphaerales bacterium]|nr:hypothetical protein [Phycisphaerales bacterium]
MAIRKLLLSVVLLLAACESGAKRVYQMTFEPPSGWSGGAISKAPKDQRTYLGNFAPGKPVTLSIAKLPKHERVRISFDFLVMGGWSGSSTVFGYSRWDMETGDGRSLIHTTFCNWGGAYTNNNEQAFPETYPARPYPGWTLAAEKQTLGTMINTQYGKPYDASAVYHFDLTFPHTAENISFGFYSMEQGWKEKYFGFANVVVEALPASPALTEAQLAGLWKDLGDMNPQKFFAAQWKLIAAGDQAVDYIAKHIDENIDPSGAYLAELVESLKKATDENGPRIYDDVTRLGYIAIAPLRAAAADGAIDAKTKAMLDRARVDAKRYNESPTQLRQFRTRHLLQVIHSPAAMSLRLSIPEPPPRNLDLN